MVLNADGNISQSVTYIPYGEVFVEERNGTWNSPTCSIPRKSLNNLYDFVFNS